MKYLTTSSLALICMLVGGSAEARILDDTVSMAPGHVSFAAEFQAGLQRPNPLTVQLHERIGLFSGLDLTLDQWIGLQDASDLRIGGGVKWTILRHKKGRPGLALWGGAFYDTEVDAFGLHPTFMIDYRFGRITPYAAFDLEMWFDDGVDPRFGLLGGVRIGLVNHVDLYFEAGAGLTGDFKNHFMSGGLRIWI